jgi:hypothetical protein
LDSLTDLTIEKSKCYINIAPGAFNGISNLQVFSLKGSKLPKLGSNVLTNLPYLRHLNLIACSIREFDSSALDDVKMSIWLFGTDDPAIQDQFQNSEFLFLI